MNSGKAEPKRRSARIEVYKDKADEFRWRFIGANGEKMGGPIDGYHNKGDVFHAIRVIAAQFEGAPVTDLTVAPGTTLLSAPVKRLTIKGVSS